MPTYSTKSKTYKLKDTYCVYKNVIKSLLFDCIISDNKGGGVCTTSWIQTSGTT